MSKKHRTTLSVVQAQKAPSDSPLSGFSAGWDGYETLKQRMLRRVSPLVWPTMMADIHAVVDRYAEASDRVLPRVKVVG